MTVGSAGPQNNFVTDTGAAHMDQADLAALNIELGTGAGWHPSKEPAGVLSPT